MITNWSPSDMLEVNLAKPDDFLKVKETLTRIGVSSNHGKRLVQSCHILHKQGRYFIMHFKELFLLDGKEANLTENDIQRRNTIATLLAEWGLLTLTNGYPKQEDRAPLRQIKIISFKDKDNWTLDSKYQIGNTKSVYND